jgi:mono/diheme cytochrome c family protein
MRRIALLLAALVVSPALAGEDAITLKDAPGRDVLLNNCAACHSLDYVQTNSPFPTQKLWDAEVTKMIKVYGAPISDSDAKVIVDYLAKNYGS